MFKGYDFISGDPRTWPEITKDAVIEELIFIHKKIWDYAIEHGYRPTTPYINNCTACDIAFKKRVDVGSRFACQYCPIEWPDGETCQSGVSLYDLWNSSLGATKEKYARLIRDVEWREDV